MFDPKPRWEEEAALYFELPQCAQDFIEFSLLPYHFWCVVGEKKHLVALVLQLSRSLESQYKLPLLIVMDLGDDGTRLGSILGWQPRGLVCPVNNDRILEVVFSEKFQYQGLNELRWFTTFFLFRYADNLNVVTA